VAQGNLKGYHYLYSHCKKEEGKFRKEQISMQRVSEYIVYKKIFARIHAVKYAKCACSKYT
jgi:hypothetical protein